MLLKILFSLSLLHAGFITAKLEDHFKQAINKTDLHKMENIDFIYMINLDARPEKFQYCLSQLLPYGIHPYRFSAVNGWELSLEEINDVALSYEPGMKGTMFGTSFLPENHGKPSHELIRVYGKKYFGHYVSQGMIGCTLSHLSVLQDAYDSKYPTIWVMEDDIEVIQDPRKVSHLIQELDDLVGKDNWDVLFTDYSTKDRNGHRVFCQSYAPRPNFTPNNPKRFAEYLPIPPFIKIGARYGTYSMIVRRSGIEKILTFIKEHQIFLAYDMELSLPNDIQMFVVQEDVVSTCPQAPSDNVAPNYLKTTSQKQPDSIDFNK